MKVTIDTTNKTFEVCTKGESIDFNHLIVELQKTIERCKGTITIVNNTSTTGIPNPFIGGTKTPNPYNIDSKSTCIRNNFQ